MVGGWWWFYYQSASINITFKKQSLNVIIYICRQNLLTSLKTTTNVGGKEMLRFEAPWCHAEEWYLLCLNRNEVMQTNSWGLYGVMTMKRQRGPCLREHSVESVKRVLKWTEDCCGEVQRKPSEAGLCLSSTSQSNHQPRWHLPSSFVCFWCNPAGLTQVTLHQHKK